MSKYKNKKSVLFVYTLKRSALGLFVFLGIFGASAAFIPVATDTAYAATNESINFQARLLRANGSVVPDGQYNVEFKIYNAATSAVSPQGSCTGDVNCLWTETRTTSNRVRVANGYLTVSLGSLTAFPPNMDWTQDLWLTMNIGDNTLSPTWDGPMNPRLKLTAVPYAMSAAQAARANTLQNATGFASTLSFTTQTAARSIFLPDEAGTLCIQGSLTCGFAPTTGGTGYIQNGLTAQAANFVVQSANAANVAGTLKGAVGQSVDVFRVTDSNDAIMFKVGNTGAVLSKNTVDSTNAFDIQNSGGTSLFAVNTSSNEVTIGANSELDVFTKLSDPTTTPTGTARSQAFSPDGQYLSVAHDSSPSLTIYKRSGDTFTKLANPASLPAGNGRGTAWSPDGVYLTVANVNSPYITIYKRSGDTFTKLADPASLPTGQGNSTAWSSDGKYMSVAHTNSPYVTIYKRSGDTFTKLANPASLPDTGVANTVKFSPDGTYLVVTSVATRTVTIYKINKTTDTFTKLADPANLPSTSAYGISFTPDSTYMAIAHTSSPLLSIYKVDKTTDTFTKLANPASAPATGSYEVAFSPDGLYLSVISDNGPNTAIYKRSGDTFTKLTTPSAINASGGRATTWSPDGRYMTTGYINSPYMTIYRHGTKTTINGALEVNSGLMVNGRASGQDALSNNEFTTLGQVQNLISASAGDPNSILNGGNSFGGAISIGSNDAYAVNFKVGGNTAATINTNGSAQFKNITDSTTAFSIQNAGGSSLFNVDTSTNNITLGNGATSITIGNTGTTAPWTTAANALPAAVSSGAVTSSNGYVYWVGGYNSGYLSAVYHAKLNPNGTTGTWSTSANSLPGGLSDLSVVANNGYLYAIGGYNGTVQTAVYIAKQNSDGTIGAWATSSKPLLDARTAASAMVSNGYVYVVGGFDGTFTRKNTTYYAKLNPDGTTGAWATSANTLPAVRSNAGGITVNGYLYIIGGTTGTPVATTYYAKTNPDGSIGAWATSANSMPAARLAMSVVSNGEYIYSLGGNDAGGSHNEVYATKVASDGSIGAWSTSANTLPDNRQYAGGVMAGGYMYLIGGGNASGPQSTVYYSAALQRNNIGGSTVFTGTVAGVQAQNADEFTTLGQVQNLLIAAGASADSILQGGNTFGATMTIGTNDAYGMNVKVGGTVVQTIGTDGATTFKNSTNSATGFRVQNAAGTTDVLSVNTTTPGVTINGDINVTGTFSGTKTLFKNTSDSATAFDIQNASGQSLFTVDTLNNKVNIVGLNLNIQNDGAIGEWQTNANALTTAKFSSTSVTNNGYIYNIGGGNGAEVYHAKLSSDGTAGTWTTSANPLPAARNGATAVVANNYIYVMGGGATTSGLTTVFISKINSDGTLGAWTTSSNILPVARYWASSVTRNNYIYLIGGGTSSTGGYANTVYYAPVNPSSGEITASWNTTTVVPASLLGATADISNNRLYVTGGYNGTVQTGVYYASFNSDGTIGAWTTSGNTLPVGRSLAASTAGNGFLYVIGGSSLQTNASAVGTTYYAAINPATGAVGTWSTSASALPSAAQRWQSATASANGYVYVLGGYSSAGASTSTVYYASLQRTIIGGTTEFRGTVVGQDALNNNEFATLGQLKAMSANDILNGGNAFGADVTIGTLDGYNVNVGVPDKFAKIANPSSLPTSTGLAVAYSPDGLYMSVAQTTTPFIIIYKRTGDTYTKLPNPATLPGSQANGTAFSPDGLYMSVAQTTTPFIVIYKIDKTTDTFTKLTDPATLPASVGYGTAFSPDGLYMSVSHGGSPYVTIYKIDKTTDTFTKLANPATLPAGNPNGTAFSPDGLYMSVSHGGSPYVTIYKIDKTTDTFTKLANPASLPPVSTFVTGTSFSANGLYMNVTTNASPYVTIYKIDKTTDIFTKLINPAVLPPDQANGTAFSPDGLSMAVVHNTAPFVSIYKSGTAINLNGETTVKGSLDVTGALTTNGNSLFRNTSNSSNAFLIQNASGSNLFSVATDSGSISIGLAGSDDIFSKVTNPLLPSGSITDTAYSSDGLYMSASNVNSPYITTYKRSGDAYAKLPNPSSLPTGVGNGVAYSPDVLYMSVAHTTTPFVTIYKIDKTTDTFTKLTDPATLPASAGIGTTFSPDGKYMSVVHVSSPYVTIYKIDKTTDTFTKLANPATLPGVSGLDSAFSNDGLYLSVSTFNTPYVTIYKIDKNTDTFTKLTNPATLPAGAGAGTAFAPDGKYLAVTSSASPYVTIYKIDKNTDTFTKLTNPATLPAGTGAATTFSPDGKYLTVTHGTSPYVTIYKIDKTTDTFTKLANPATLPAGTSMTSTAFSPDSQYMTISSNGTPSLLIYRKGNQTNLLGNVTIGGAGGSLTINSNGQFTLSGDARRTKKITLTPEYAGAVLDASGDATCASANSGTLTGGLDVVNRMNYYNWMSTQVTAQCYNVVVQVPLPSDFDSWASTNPLKIRTYSSNLTNGTAAVELRDSNNSVIYNYTNITPGTVNSWSNTTITTPISGSYNADDALTLRIRVSSSNSANLRIGNITFDYLSKY